MDALSRVLTSVSGHLGQISVGLLTAGEYKGAQGRESAGHHTVVGITVFSVGETVDWVKEQAMPA